MPLNSRKYSHETLWQPQSWAVLQSPARCAKPLHRSSHLRFLGVVAHLSAMSSFDQTKVAWPLSCASYTITGALGSGTFGTVFAAKRQSDWEPPTDVVSHLGLEASSRLALQALSCTAHDHRPSR